MPNLTLPSVGGDASKATGIARFDFSRLKSVDMSSFSQNEMQGYSTKPIVSHYGTNPGKNPYAELTQPNYSKIGFKYVDNKTGSTMSFGYKTSHLDYTSSSVNSNVGMAA